jgi:outer membrane protein W
MKTITLALAAVLSIASVNAQNLSFGPTAGFGHSWTNSEKGSLDRMFHPSYNLGGKLVYSFVSHWGISGDVKFSSEGQTLGVDNENKVVGRLNYIRVPLQGIYFFGEYGDAVRPKVSLGPSFGFLVGGKTKTYEDDEVIATAKSKDYAEGFDFGVTGAIGANFRISPNTWLNTDIAYYHGVTDVLKNAMNENAKNRNLGLNVGLTFGIGTVKPAK